VSLPYDAFESCKMGPATQNRLQWLATKTENFS